jgi:hypothetical protein
MLFDAHWHGFGVFGGIPSRGIYDKHEDGGGSSRGASRATFALNSDE